MSLLISTSHCAQCKKLATEIGRVRRTREIVARSYPNGPVIEFGGIWYRFTVHVACRPEFLKRVAELPPQPAIVNGERVPVL